MKLVFPLLWDTVCSFTGFPNSFHCSHVHLLVELKMSTYSLRFFGWVQRVVMSTDRDRTVLT